MLQRASVFVGLIGLIGLIGAVGCGENRLKGPESEVSQLTTKIEVPPVPKSLGELPPAPSDGSHLVKELRVKGKKLLDTDVTVKGFVTWAYDCPTAVRQPGEDDKSVWARIEAQPSLCERAKLYIGDTKDTPPEKSLWVVGIPRPFNQVEIRKFKKKTRESYPDKCEPDEKDPKKKLCPPYAVGDEIEVVGSFRLSAGGDHNSEGLLEYKRMKNKTQNWESPPEEATPAAGVPPPAGPGARPSPQDLVNQHKTKS